MAKFDLHVRETEGDYPASVRILISEWTGQSAHNSNGDVLVSPNCRSFEEVSAQIDLLQSGLEALRRKARLHFRSGVSPRSTP